MALPMANVEVLLPGPAPIRRVNSSGRKRGHPPRPVAWAVACVVLGLLIGAGAGIAELALGDAGLPPAPSTPRVAGIESALQPQRAAPVVYPYSIVPGGVHGPDEAMAAAERDQVVANHYRDLRLAALRAVPVDRPRAVHVSYRVGDHVYWTKRKVVLQAGEVLLTDGSRTIRARCGNCVSDVARGPVSDQEPAPEVFDRPVRTAGTTPGGGIAPLRAYDLFASNGLMPPAPSGSPFTGPAPPGGAGVPGLGAGTPFGFSGGFPAGLGGGGGGGFGGTTDGNRPAGTDNPGGVLPPGSDGSPFSGMPPPSDGDAPPPFGGGTPTPPGGGTPPPAGGTPPPPGGTLVVPPPPGGGTPPPPGGVTPPPGGGTLIPPSGPGGDGGTPEPPAQVPEPGTVLLLVGGLSALAARRLHRRR